MDLKLAVLNGCNMKIDYEDLNFVLGINILSVLQNLITRSEAEFYLFSSDNFFNFAEQTKSLQQQENITKKVSKV